MVFGMTGSRPVPKLFLTGSRTGSRLVPPRVNGGTGGTLSSEPVRGSWARIGAMCPNCQRVAKTARDGRGMNRR
jgi:hypothetical protein